MASLRDHIDAIVAPVAPAQRLAAVRIFVGLFATIYLIIRAASLASVAHLDKANYAPVGPARWIVALLDKLNYAPAGPARLIAAPLPAWLVYAGVAATIALSIPFLLGLYFRVTGPLFAAVLLWVLSYRNSFGMIFHTENLLVLHVAILAFSDSAAAFSLDARRSGLRHEPAPRYGFGLQLLGAVTALAYVLAGVAKLRTSGLAWATGDVLKNQVAHDNLRKLLLGDSYSPLGAWAARHSWLFPPFAFMTLVVELGAPIVLLRGRVAKLWVLAAWGFHVGVLALMWILFPYQLFFVAFASFFNSERLIEGVMKRVRALRKKTPAAKGAESERRITGKTRSEEKAAEDM